MNLHEKFMKDALGQAELALSKNEVPVGAVIVADGKIIARGYNQTEQLQDATAHAEMIALTSAFNYFGAKYLPDCSIYVTLEPCVMCAGALNWAQIGLLCYGADDPQRGYQRHNGTHGSLLHPKTKAISHIFEEESMMLLNTFFKKIRS